MHTSTNFGRWLFMAFVLFSVAGTATAQRTVTLKLNTATLSDTLRTVDEIQVRGALASGTALPDGGVIDWNDATTLRPANVGGDMWEVQFQIPDNDELKFKFYADKAELSGIGGWEDGGDHVIAAGTGDVEMPVHFFEKGDDKEYDWRPFTSHADSVSVLLRVYAKTASGLTAGYKSSSEDAIVVAGDPLGGVSQMDWNDGSGVVLSRETDDRGKPGFNIFSGLATYPASAAGTNQPYKFLIAPGGWEDGISDRGFTIPTADSTVHWVFFDNTPAVDEAPVTAPVIFSVDVTPLEDIGVFSRARGDTLSIRGSFNGWVNACDDLDKCLLDRIPGTNTFEGFFPLTLIPEVTLEYKYRIHFNNAPMRDEWNVDVVPSGWEEPYSTSGGNRKVDFVGNPDIDQVVEQTYNDIFPRNIMLGGDRTDVHFSVDMTPAMSAAEPFNAAADTVLLAFGDPIFSMTQGFPLTPRDDSPNEGDALNLNEFADQFQLTDPDGDMIYEGVLTVIGPTYAAMQYQIAYGGTAGWQQEQGGGNSSDGRRRQRFVPQNPDGSWPAEYAVQTETYAAEGDLPGDSNPAVVVGVEEVGGELPKVVSLSKNYPNPFNPTTSFEYSIDRAADVTVQVYDILGRVVATLVDGVQQAASYRVNFDAKDLASGTYIYRLQTPNQVLTRTMVLIK